MVKKREMLPTLNNAINALVKMNSDFAKLELMDNEQASRRVKRDLASFKQKELKSLAELIYGVRTDIQSLPKRPQSEKQKLNLKPKNKQHESESDDRS